jgi:hypothetical protein
MIITPNKAERYSSSLHLASLIMKGAELFLGFSLVYFALTRDASQVLENSSPGEPGSN